MKAAGLTAVVGLLAVSQGYAQFPERKVQVMYPWAPGTPTYGVSQLIAEGMAKELGQAVPVVAKPGSGGVKAFKAFLNSPADGYTIADGYVAPLVLAPMFGNADWGCDDFIPLYSATSNSFAIATRPNDDRWSDFKSFIGYLKDHPGETRYNGNELTLPHMVAAKVLKQLDIVSRPVPYPDLALGMKDLRNGTLDWLIVNPGMYRANKDHLKILATLSNQKAVQEVYDGAPTPKDVGVDLGISGLTASGWDWWLVHKDTPEDRLDKLRGAMQAALKDKDVRDGIAKAGFVPTNYSPDEYSKVCNSVSDELKSAKDAVEWEKKKVRALSQ
ncbi:Bug family tripartite tricarboxylate transporter substrate binding protein [Pararhizobium mangrovi]|uniref:Bug family tripartite tricarboxylate transporter substrate binding protein n=1 Tax=Pararhizobium mangrovi TaxID=2590452 RepID=UPI0015E8622C|nr:tripartite tricarboxylate transporter substrate-binding protein [Pararhizobium mangrovi]